MVGNLRDMGTRLKKALLMGAFVPLLIQCSGISAPTSTNATDNESALEAQVRAELASVAPTGSASYFQLPQSNDYASIPQDPNNPITEAKVALGQKLFHEPALLANPNNPKGFQLSSCASCHVAAAGFTAGIRQGIGEGGYGYGTAGAGRVMNPSYSQADLDVRAIRSPPTINTAFQIVMTSSGQFGANGINANTQSDWLPSSPQEFNYLGYDGVETLGIAGQDIHRMDITQSHISSNPSYQQMFQSAFGSGTQLVSQVNAGLAMGAYLRTVLSNQAPFQQLVGGQNQVMSSSELNGALLFFGKANCYQCHTGPALDSMSFHGMGMNDLTGTGIYQSNPSAVENLGRGGFTGESSDKYHFKTPQLYNLADVKYLGHGGTFNSVQDVVEYLNTGKAQNSKVPVSQLDPLFVPLNLSSTEITDLTNFVQISLHDPNLTRYLPSTVPSGKCFPDADAQSIVDLGCILSGQ